MDLKWVNTFITVFEEGSFRAASEKLFISQPSITVHIKALEEQLQVKLFKREHTKITITDAGKQYYVLAKKLLVSVEEAKKEIQLIDKNKKTRLVIALSSALISTNILKIIHDFMEIHANYEIEMMMEDANNMVELLKNQHIDVVISLMKVRSKALHSEQIFSAPIKIVHSSKVKLEGDTYDQKLNQLFNQLPLGIGYLDEHPLMMEWLERTYKVKKVNKVQDSIFAIKLIKENLMIGLLPEFLIETELTEGKLTVMDNIAIASLDKVNVYMSHKRNQAQIQQFLGYVRNHFQ